MRQTILSFFQFLRLLMVIVSISIVNVPTANATSCEATFDIYPPTLGGPCPIPLTKEQNVLVKWPGGTQKLVELKGIGKCCEFCPDCKAIPISYCSDLKNEGGWPSFYPPESDYEGNVTMKVKDGTCSVTETDCELSFTPPLSPVSLPINGKKQTMSTSESTDRTVRESSPCPTPPSPPPGDGGGGDGGGGGGYVCTPYYYIIDSYDCNYNYTECNYLGSSYGGYAGCW